MLLFGIPSTKDELGLESYADDGVVQQAIRALKDASPELVVVTDVCLCEYTDHGHCGLLDADGYVLNDETLEILGRIAVSHAEAGADVVAPSGMIDGMVGAIRARARRRAASSASRSSRTRSSTRRRSTGRSATPPRARRSSATAQSHQMDPANAREALREAALDVEQGADALLVKPALGYLDVVARVRERFPELPLAAYNVSGEYAMVKAAAANGWLDERAVALEVLTGHPPRGRRSHRHLPREGRGALAPGSVVTARVDDRPDEETVDEADVAEHGRTAEGETTSLDRRLFMQLQAFGGASDTAALVSALEAAGVEGVLYEDVNDPTGVALLTLSETPDAFVVELRGFLQAAPFAELEPKPELTMLGRTYAIGHEQDLEETLVERPRGRVLDPELRWAIWYPLRRAGSFEQLSRKEQNAILMEHGGVGHVVRARGARVRHPARVPRARQGSTTTSSSGCSAPSCTRSRSSSSACGRRGRPRSTSSGWGRSSSAGWRGRAARRDGGRRRADADAEPTSPFLRACRGLPVGAHARLAPAPGGAVHAGVPRAARAALDARADPRRRSSRPR